MAERMNPGRPRPERLGSPEILNEFPPEAMDRYGERYRAGSEVEVFVPEFYGATGRVVAWSRTNRSVLVAMTDPVLLTELSPATCRIIA